MTYQNIEAEVGDIENKEKTSMNEQDKDDTFYSDKCEKHFPND